jgi:hypothetical protein
MPGLVLSVVEKNKRFYMPLLVVLCYEKKQKVLTDSLSLASKLDVFLGSVTVRCLVRGNKENTAWPEEHLHRHSGLKLKVWIYGWYAIIPSMPVQS